MLSLLILLQILDAITTLLVLKQGGKEANPVMAYLFKMLGTIPALVVTKGLAIVLVLSVALPELLLFVLIAFYSWVLINNINAWLTK